MKTPTQVSVILVGVLLAAALWYATVMPFWLTQSGERNDTIYYSQGIGIWLNYTEHVGDLEFDPGNALWIPPQSTDAHTFASQCSQQPTFCNDEGNATIPGELYEQYCEVMHVYCGTPMLFLQLVMSVCCGMGALVAVWCFVLITTRHRTVVDQYLLILCVSLGAILIAVGMFWYFHVFMPVMDSKFYGNQYTRCHENSDGKSCWGMGTSTYLVLISATGYTILGVLVTSESTNKYRSFKKSLKRLYENAASIDLPPARVTLEQTSLGQHGQASEQSRPVQTLQKTPSSVGKSGRSSRRSRNDSSPGKSFKYAAKGPKAEEIAK